MFWIKLASLVVLAFSSSFLLTPATIRLCHKVGALDKPDGKRKINTLPIPRIGGLAFFTAFFIFALPFAAKDRFVAAILSAGSVLIAGGFADDVFDIPPIIKLFIQACSAFIAITLIGAPESISFFGLFNVTLNASLGAVIAVFKMLFTINAVNFSDGLDGLAAGLSTVAFISLFFYGLENNTTGAVCSIILAAAVIGFLPYNKYRAKTFMGDSGSQFLGFSFAILSLGCAPGNAYTLETTFFLLIPALDTALSILRRLAKRRSPFSADKGHLHHILLKSGLSHPDAVRLLVLCGAFFAAVTLIFTKRI